MSLLLVDWSDMEEGFEVWAGCWDISKYRGIAEDVILAPNYLWRCQPQNQQTCYFLVPRHVSRLMEKQWIWDISSVSVEG